MATNKNTIKNWFLTGLIPTQEQFWAVFDSYRHKDETIPTSSIEQLDTILSAKTENDQFNAHKADTDAHAELFEAKLDKSTYTGTAQDLKTAIDDLNSLVNGLQDKDSITDLDIANLQSQIDAINLILTSNDVNLDSVQELVDAIKTVQTSLNTILVNDLTTGGVTKALTAQMGVTLKGLIDALTTIVNGNTTNIAANTTAIGTKEDHINKTDDITGKESSSVWFLSAKGVYNFVTSLFQTKNTVQFKVTTSQNIDPAWNGGTVLIKGNVTLTATNSLLADFNCNIFTCTGFTLGWAVSGTKTWALGTPPSIGEKTMIHIFVENEDPNKVYVLS